MQNIIYNLGTIGLGTDDVMFAVLLSIGVYLVVAELRTITKSLSSIRFHIRRMDSNGQPL